MGIDLEIGHRSDMIDVIEDVLGPHLSEEIADTEALAHGVVSHMTMRTCPCPDDLQEKFRRYKFWSWRRWIGEYKILVQLRRASLANDILLEISFSTWRTLFATVVCGLTSWSWAREFLLMPLFNAK